MPAVVPEVKRVLEAMELRPVVESAELGVMAELEQMPEASQWDLRLIPR